MFFRLVYFVTLTLTFPNCFNFIPIFNFLIDLVFESFTLCKEQREGTALVPLLCLSSRLDLFRETAEETGLHRGEVRPINVLELVQSLLGVADAFEQKLQFHRPDSPLLVVANYHFYVLIVFTSFFEHIFDLKQSESFGRYNFAFELLLEGEQEHRVGEGKDAARYVFHFFERILLVRLDIFQDFEKGSRVFLDRSKFKGQTCIRHRLQIDIILDILKSHLHLGYFRFECVNPVLHEQGQQSVVVLVSCPFLVFACV